MAALDVHGEVVLAAAGASVDGYKVLGIEEDSGVRLRSPEGQDILLATSR